MDIQELLTRLKGKQVAIRKMDRERTFTLIGILADVADGHVYLENAEYGDKIILISDIVEAEERVERRGGF